MAGEKYNGPSGEARPTTYVGWAPGNPNGAADSSRIILAIEDTCALCTSLCESGMCLNPQSLFYRQFRGIGDGSVEKCDNFQK